jgi:hypothetical protein
MEPTEDERALALKVGRRLEETFGHYAGWDFVVLDVSEEDRDSSTWTLTVHQTRHPNVRVRVHVAPGED